MSSDEELKKAAPPMAELLFACFVFVADAEDGLIAREVQAFHDSINSTAWCRSPVMRAGLDALRSTFGDFWKDYQQKGVRPDLRMISFKVSLVVNATSGVSRSDVSFFVSLFLDRVLGNASPILQRLGLSSTTAAKQKARQSLLGQLAQSDADIALDLPDVQRAQDPPPAPQGNPAHSVATVDLSLWPAAQMEFVHEKVWKRGRTPVRCITVIPETHDVKTFVFQAVSPVLFRYKPGQFATLELPIDGKTVRRSYTISSSPSRPHTISITVKRVPGGLVSNWLHDNMVAGFQFNLSGPNGEFTCFDAPAEKLLFLSGGSGITPVMSMTRWLVDTQSSANIVFINNVRTPADIIFESELAYLGTRLGSNLKLGIVPGAVLPGQTWNGPVSFMSETLLRSLAPDFAERTVFVCGPPPYMDAVRKLLESLGFPMARYHQESFGGPAPAAPQPGAPKPVSSPAAPAKLAAAVTSPPPVAIPSVDVNGSKLEIVFSRSGKTVAATSEDFILDIAEQHDIHLESSCRAGNCGTCRVKKTEGEVQMDDQRALSESDLLDGFVLACVGRAAGSRLVLEA